MLLSKKFTKRNSERERSPSAELAESGALTAAPPFEKGGRKFFHSDSANKTGCRI